MAWQPVRIWPGQTVVVLGGGPSLTECPEHLWRAYRTVGVNQAYRLGPDALFFQDYEFWGESRQGHGPVIKRDYAGLVVTTSPQLRNEPRVKFVERERRRRHGLPNPGTGEWPEITNSGQGAICLAYQLGAARIVLIGFDGRATGNWYDNPRAANEQAFANRFRPGIESTLEPLRRAGVDLINATPGSALDLPTATPEDVL